MNDVALEFENVTCGYGDTMVVRSMSGRVSQGSVVAVVGRNGVGKTTLMKTLAGFLPVSGGSLRWRCADLAALAPHERLKLGISYSPQENVVFGDLSVNDNLWLHLRERRGERYEEMLREFPRLKERLAQAAGLLSGGERKLLAFARTMGLGACINLFDEPTEGVQPENIDRMALLIRAHAEAGRSFLVVEQNLSFVEKIADEVIVMDRGEAVVSGKMSDLGRATLERYLQI
ncbi:ABC transporter ATP-binding protein [Paraburkholderia tropica]|uniref:ABC transporter ATP-binding protein n=1 Tax=Paraburkholderia tropica TaxID=92647 RepID=UPI002AB6948D|nr:ATP-binding cassette domain-containing protein [Paraburkholderia tropica]